MEYILADNFYRDDLDSREVMVSIHCITYNHEKYLRDALEGFVMQKTNFRFEAIVHDDASTDGTAAILREYAEKYPSIIKPIFETENQYSKADGSLSRIMNAHLRGKYIAFCEGDDYWTDPLKLQKQVDFLESHPDYSLCATNALNLSNNNFTPSGFNVTDDRDSAIEEIIMKGGLFLATVSLVFRKDYYFDKPKEMYRLYIGDYPLQIYMAWRGNVRIMSDITCVYRLNSEGSWTSRVNDARFNFQKVSERNIKEFKVLDTMDSITCGKFHNIFRDRKAVFEFNSLFFFEGLKCFRYFLNSPRPILRYCSIKHILASFLPKKIKRKLRS